LLKTEGSIIMPKIKLDDIEYNTEDLSDHGQAVLKSLQFLEVQLQKLKNEIGVYQTAQRTYAAALKAEIKKSGVEPMPAEDTSEE
jgi:hypothetical protein